MARERIAALDLGTTRTVVLIGEIADDGLRILGRGASRSRGLRRGVVVNMDEAARSIDEALRTAERDAGARVNEVFVGFSGEHIESVNSSGAVAIATDVGRGVTQEDVFRAREAATALKIPSDRQVIHVLTQDHIVDDQCRIPDPCGMSGVRLEVLVHIVTGAVTPLRNVRNCIEQSGMRVRELVLDTIASCESALTSDEKELGVVLLDLGGGTTKVALFHQGSIRHSAVIPAGGNNLTNDIAIGLRTPHEDAERIKCCYASAVYVRPDRDNLIEVPGVGGREPREVTREELAFVVGPRIKELLLLAREEIRSSGFEDLVGTGVVITGGGALIPGIAKQAEQVFGMSAKIGAPEEVPGLENDEYAPTYATSVGLLRYAMNNLSEKERLNGTEGGLLDRVLSRIAALV
ncbi:MAG: cell division protein FtsA [Gemmatimonadota bacterium]|nr:cell division protein FtsA [Gemmatimonadota bacterium]